MRQSWCYNLEELKCKQKLNEGNAENFLNCMTQAPYIELHFLKGIPKLNINVKI